MGSRYVKIDRSSRQLLRGHIPNASFRQRVHGPYVTTVGGLLMHRDDTVLQDGTSRSRFWADGERDRSAGPPDEERA